MQSDLTLSPCYVVKQDGIFAHGESLGEAMEALRDKMFSDMPQEERIEAFIKEHELGEKYENGDFFLWHHYLTGSCEMGRRAFVRDKGIDLSGRSTPEEFIALTKNAYGGEVIKELARRYGIEEGDKDNAHKHSL